jgi:hypothetical protein
MHIWFPILGPHRGSFQLGGGTLHLANLDILCAARHCVPWKDLLQRSLRESTMTNPASLSFVPRLGPTESSNRIDILHGASPEPQSL